MNAYHITQEAIKEAAINNGTSVLTEKALAARSSGSGVIRPVSSNESTAYTGGVLSGFSSAVGSAVSDVVGTAAGVVGGLFRGVGSAFAAPSARGAIQPIPEDAGSAYHSLPDDTQTSEESLSSHAADMQHATDVASQRSESIRSQVSQHLQDVGAQHVLLPVSSSSSGISDTLPAPPSQYYQPNVSSSSSSRVSGGVVSVHSSPAASLSHGVGVVHQPSYNQSTPSSRSRRSDVVHQPSYNQLTPSSASARGARSGGVVSVRSSPLVSVNSSSASPPASAHGVQRFSIASSSPPISIHSSASDYYTFDAIGQRHVLRSTSSSFQ